MHILLYQCDFKFGTRYIQIELSTAAAIIIETKLQFLLHFQATGGLDVNHSHFLNYGMIEAGNKWPRTGVLAITYMYIPDIPRPHPIIMYDVCIRVHTMCVCTCRCIHVCFFTEFFCTGVLLSLFLAKLKNTCNMLRLLQGCHVQVVVTTLLSTTFTML